MLSVVLLLVVHVSLVRSLTSTGTKRLNSRLHRLQTELNLLHRLHHNEYNEYHSKYNAKILDEYANNLAMVEYISDVSDDMSKPYSILNQGTTRSDRCKWVKNDLENSIFNQFPATSNDAYTVDCGFKLGGSDAKKKILKKDTIIWSIQKKFDVVTEASFFHSTPNIRKDTKMTDDEFFIPYKVSRDVDILYYQNYHTDSMTVPPDYETDKRNPIYSDVVGYVTCSYCYIFIEKINRLEANPADTASNKYNKDSIPKLRAFCHYIYVKAGAQIDTEIKKVLDDIYSWYRFEIAAKTDDSATLSPKEKKAIVNQFNPPKLSPKAAGMVPPTWEDVIAVIARGNMREKMQLIYSNVFMSCKLLWKVLFSYYFNQNPTLATTYTGAASLARKWIDFYEKIFKNTNNLNKRINQLEKLTGFQFHDLYPLQDGVLTVSDKGYPNLCIQARPMKIGAVRLSRSINYPKIRVDRVPTGRPAGDPRFIKKKDVYPPLSFREEHQIRTQHDIDATVVWNDETLIPWETGFWWSDPSPDSIWKTIPDKFGLLSIAGPSGSGNVLMDIGLSFQADTTYFLAANIIYMGVPPDHSLYELIFALDKNWYPGLDDYYVEQDPYCWFLKKLNAK